MIQNYDRLYSSDIDKFSFYHGVVGNSTSADLSETWVTWTKPRDCNLVYIFCLGAGGGGGGGQCHSGTSYYLGGGAGGGEGAFMHTMIPAFMLPENLYILCGNGGLGGSGDFWSGTSNQSFATSGQDGSDTFVCIYPDKNLYNRVGFAAAGKGGGCCSAGSVSSPAAAADYAPGVPGGARTMPSSCFHKLGFFTSLGARIYSEWGYGIGSRGAKGNYPAGGAYINNAPGGSGENTHSFATAGTGGGGITGNGTGILDSGNMIGLGPFNGVSPIPSIIRTSANLSGQADGYNYANIYSNFNTLGSLNNTTFITPFLSTGGVGGNPSTHGVTRYAGNGGFGSGGGGGGAQTATGTAERYGGYGGHGGPGIVIIQCI